MKNIYTAALILAGLFAAVPARAQVDFSYRPGSVRQAQSTTEVTRASHTVERRLIAVGSGTDVTDSASYDVSLSTNAGWTKVTVTNMDSAAKVYCSERSAVTTTAGAQRGQPINTAFNSGGGWWHDFFLAPGERLYCRNDGGSGSTSTEAIVERRR